MENPHVMTRNNHFPFFFFLCGVSSTPRVRLGAQLCPRQEGAGAATCPARAAGRFGVVGGAFSAQVALLSGEAPPLFQRLGFESQIQF